MSSDMGHCSLQMCSMVFPWTVSSLFFSVFLLELIFSFTLFHFIICTLVSCLVE